MKEQINLFVRFNLLAEANKNQLILKKKKTHLIFIFLIEPNGHFYHQQPYEDLI